MFMTPESSLRDFFKRNSISPDLPFVVSFSGGADSLALLVASKAIGLRCTAVYVNHNMRGADELGREMELNRRNADALGVPLKVLELPEGKVAEASAPGGAEDAARRLRYAVIGEYMSSRGFPYMLTGHNATDCDESDIIRFFRGGRPEGIREVSGRVLRPFLRLTHDELAEYARGKGFEFSEDSTNRDRSNLRSMIRLDLKPMISKVFPNYHSALEERRKLSAFVSPSDEKAIYEAFRLIGVGNSNNSRVPLETVRGVADFMLNGNDTGRMEYADAVVFRKRGECVFAKKGFDSDFPPVALDCGDSCRVGGLFGCTLYRVGRFDGIAGCAFPGNVLLLPAGRLVIRPFLPGDSLPRGGKSVGVADILKKAGVPAQIRGLVPVVELGGRPIAVCLGLFGERNAVADGILDDGGELSLLVFSRMFDERKLR